MKYRNLLAVLILSVLACASANAQKITKAYVTKNTDKGTLYFIKPIDGLFGSGKYGSVIMDFTHTSPGDSVRVNYSFYQPQFSAVDSVALTTGGKTLTFEADKLYVEPAKKSTWLHRYGFYMTKTQLREFFSGQTPSSIIIYSGGKPIEYKASENKKRAEKIATVNGVFDIIENNQ